MHEYQNHFNHLKMAVFDKRWSIHGSTNLNCRSLEDDKDFELVVLVDDEPMARWILEHVRDLDRRHARRIGQSDLQGTWPRSAAASATPARRCSQSSAFCRPQSSRARDLSFSARRRRPSLRRAFGTLRAYPWVKNNPAFASLRHREHHVVALRLHCARFLYRARSCEEQVYGNPEDPAFFKVPVSEEGDHPDVLRVKRAHANAMEGAVPFFVVGALFVSLSPGKTSALAYFGAFVGARLLHSVFYIWGKQPFRTHLLRHRRAVHHRDGRARPSLLRLSAVSYSPTFGLL